MKKFKLILSLILCLFVFSAVSCKKEEDRQVGTVSYILSVNKSTITLEEGENFRIVAVCGDEDVTFSSRDSEIATVSEDGIVTAVSAGTTYITISAGEQKKLCQISVVSYDYKLTLNETNVLMVVGAQKKITATYVCEDKTIDGKISWKVTKSDKCKLTETENGVIFTATEKGVYTLTASAENATDAICVIKVMSETATELPAPTLTKTDSTISWDAVENAETYLVKVDRGEWVEVNALSYTVAEEVETVYVRASAGENCDYYDSAVNSISLK